MTRACHPRTPPTRTTREHPTEVTRQIPLALRWPRRQRFEHFHPGSNAATLSILQRVARGEEDAWPFLAGAPGSGKTHLLMATCQMASEAGRQVQYLPLGNLKSSPEAAIRCSAGNDLLALDDVQCVAGDAAAEHALFDLYNRVRAEGATLLFASRTKPSQWPLGLPDLRSRLGACTQLVLHPLDEEQRREVLRAHAQARGIHLDEAVLDWLFAHHARDLGALHDLLERMDSMSLAAHRRITIPFLREHLPYGSSD